MNSNTLVDALRNAGVPQETPLVLTNPGGNNPWLFTLPASFASNGGQPVVLEVPTVAANGIEQGLLSGGADNNITTWYADTNVFVVRAIGRVAPNAFGKTLKLYMFAGNGLGSGSPGALQDTQIGIASATLPATGQPAAYSNWFLEAKCLWDAPSLTLTGLFSGLVAGVNIAATAFSVYNPSSWQAQAAPGAYLPLPFVIGANLSSSANATPDTVSLFEFVCDEI